MSAPRLSPEQKNEIIKAYMAGEPIASIAKRYGIDPTYPGVIARRRGCTHRKRARPRKRILVPPEIVAPVDIPIPSLADELGIKVYTHRAPNRSALGSAPLTAKSEGMDVSLPFVSILGARA